MAGMPLSEGCSIESWGVRLLAPRLVGDSRMIRGGVVESFTGLQARMASKRHKVDALRSRIAQLFHTNTHSNPPLSRPCPRTSESNRGSQTEMTQKHTFQGLGFLLLRATGADQPGPPSTEAT